jgi:hypothetical protein
MFLLNDLVVNFNEDRVGSPARWGKFNSLLALCRHSPAFVLNRVH